MAADSQAPLLKNTLNSAGPNWLVVISRLVLCIEDMELACSVRHCHFGPVLLPKASKNDNDEIKIE